MSWILISIFTHFFWALTNIGDKYIIGNRYKNPYVYLFLVNILGIGAVVLIPFINFQIPNLQVLFWLVVGSVLYLFGGMPYVRAMQIEEVSKINIWWNLLPIFSFLIEWVVFGRVLTGMHLIGFLLLISGACVASIHIGKKSIAFSKAVWYMLVSCAAFAGYGVIFGYVTGFMSFASGFVWLGIISFVLSLSSLLYIPFGKVFFKELSLMKKSTAGFTVGTCLVDRIGIFFNQLALSLAPAALVFSMEGFQVIFVFIMASAITVFYPSLLKEDLSMKNVLVKLLAIVFMIGGILVLALK